MSLAEALQQYDAYKNSEAQAASAPANGAAVQPLPVLTTKDVTPMPEPPEWLSGRTDAIVKEIDGKPELISILICNDCHKTMKVCRCGGLELTEHLIWNRAVGLNEMLIREVSAAVEPAEAPEPTKDTLPAQPVRASDEEASTLTGFAARAAVLQKRGIPCIPLLPRTKIAAIKEWQKLATTDAEQIAGWTKGNPDANCGAVAKAEIGGYWFLEVDSKDVQERIYAETGQYIPRTFAVRSSKQRGHFYFKQTAASITMQNIAQSFVKNGDWSARVDREYCCSPLSIHPKTGLAYEIISDAEIVEAPDWLVAWCILQKVEVKKAAIQDNDAPIIEGGRNNTLASMAGRMRYANLEPDEIETALLRINTERCVPPLPDDEVRVIAASIGRYPVGGQSGTAIVNGRPVGSTSAVPVPEVEDVDELSVASIPEFDPSVITGIFADIVDLITRGTTLQPQFAFAVARTVVGIRMAGRVTFENLDAEPRTYLALISETGGGKGTAWRRMLKIIHHAGKMDDSGIKVINSADSGAGIRDLFFDHAKDKPVICYVDEIANLGNKAAEGRNPAILDMMLELADSTSISRVLRTGKNKGESTLNNARLAVVMCGQSGDVYAKAFAGRALMGAWDRLCPEYGTPQLTGDMPPIEPADAARVMIKFNELFNRIEHKGGKMYMSPDAKAYLDEFWAGQPKDVLKKARWKRNILLDAFVAAFGRGVDTVELSDAVVATKIFTRQLVIRRVCFATEVPDRVGFYLGQIKRITEHMERRISAGVSPETVALSRRDYEKQTHAHRDNETHIFDRAWRVHAPNWLKSIPVVGKNGQIYHKFIPLVED